MTQKELAIELGVSRPTVIGWLDGKNVPDILSLEKIVRYFDVSADYLLGLSDTVKPNATLRAAKEYTGLSEAALECLHEGLDDFGCGLSEEGKKEHLDAASALIKNEAFAIMADKLGEIEEVVYAERILKTLRDQYFHWDDLKATRMLDRDVVVHNLMHICEGEIYEGKAVLDLICDMDDIELRSFTLSGANTMERESELAQFLAAKAFTGYIDQLIRERRAMADRRFVTKQTL